MLLAFMRNYDKNRLNASVAVPTGAALKPALADMGLTIYEIDGLAEKSFSVETVKKLSNIIEIAKPDIVHAHASLSARVAGRLRGAKVVYTRHSVFPNRPALTVFPGKLAAGAVNNLLADKIVAVSPAAMENIVETGVDARKVVVVYNGVDAIPALNDDERRAVRGEHGIGQGFACGIFARLTAVKGHKYILDAAARLTDVHFVIAGEGEAGGLIRERLLREQLTNVTMTGFLREPAKVMAAMDVQLNASYGTEATSLALLEGMSAGIPAVVSSFGGNPYVIRDGQNGFVVPQKDGAAMANAILRLKNDPVLYQKMTINAKKIYNERFTAETMTRNLENVYFLLKSGR